MALGHQTSKVLEKHKEEKLDGVRLPQEQSGIFKHLLHASCNSFCLLCFLFQALVLCLDWLQLVLNKKVSLVASWEHGFPLVLLFLHPTLFWKSGLKLQNLFPHLFKLRVLSKILLFELIDDKQKLLLGVCCWDSLGLIKHLFHVPVGSDQWSCRVEGLRHVDGLVFFGEKIAWGHVTAYLHVSVWPCDEAIEIRAVSVLKTHYGHGKLRHWCRVSAKCMSFKLAFWCLLNWKFEVLIVDWLVKVLSLAESLLIDWLIQIACLASIEFLWGFMDEKVWQHLALLGWNRCLGAMPSNKLVVGKSLCDWILLASPVGLNHFVMWRLAIELCSCRDGLLIAHKHVRHHVSLGLWVLISMLDLRREQSDRVLIAGLYRMLLNWEVQAVLSGNGTLSVF